MRVFTSGQNTTPRIRLNLTLFSHILRTFNSEPKFTCITNLTKRRLEAKYLLCYITAQRANEALPRKHNCDCTSMQHVGVQLLLPGETAHTPRLPFQCRPWTVNWSVCTSGDEADMGNGRGRKTLLYRAQHGIGMAVLGSWIALSTHAEKYKNMNISIHIHTYTHTHTHEKKKSSGTAKSKDGIILLTRGRSNELAVIRRPAGAQH